MTTPIPINDSSELIQFTFWCHGQKYNISDTSAFFKKGRDKVGGYEWGGPCPSCGGTDRFVVSNGNYWCRQRCGCQGRLKIGIMSPQDLIAQAERQADLYRRAQEKEETERREREEKIASLTSSMIHMQFHENLLADKEMLEEVYRMGLLEETVDQFRIGINPAFTFMEDEKLVTVKALTIPVISWDGMRVMNIRHRILDPLYTKKNKYRPIYKGLGNYFLHATRDTSTCFIVEGEKKAMVLWWFGFSAIGLFGIDDHKPEWYELWHQKYSRLVVCFDNDSKAVISSGKLFARELGASWVDLGGKPDDLLLGQDESLAQAALAKLYGMEQREETQIGNMERITTI